MTNKQLLTKYTAEHTAKVAARSALDSQIAALEQVLAGLHTLEGRPAPVLATPTRRRRTEATGTKALILDVLADGTKRSAIDIAAACGVKKGGAFNQHLIDLVREGDVLREGASRSTRYRIA